MDGWWIIGAIVISFVIVFFMETGKKKPYVPPVMVMGDDGKWHCLDPKECREPLEDPNTDTNPHAI